MDKDYVVCVWTPATVLDELKSKALERFTNLVPHK